MINMLDFNELDAAQPHVHGKKIGHPNMGEKKGKRESRAWKIYRVAACTRQQSRSNSKQLC